MKKIFIVTNQSLHHDSSYYDVVDVALSLEEAQTIIGTSLLDFIHGVERGEFPDFSSNTIEITAEEWECTAKDAKTGMFEKWTIHCHNLPQR